MTHSRVFTILFLCLLLPFPSVAQNSPAPIGKLVNLGGHRIHLDCTGRGSPTVVIEMGFEEFSFDWVLVQNAVSKFTRICSYDRAGYAWSDPGPLPRSYAQINLELKSALEQAGEHSPYVLVGHSYGGGPVRNFALTFPKQTAGLVFVDIVSENQRIQMGPKNTGLISDYATHKPIPEPHLAMTAADRVEPPKMEMEKPSLEPPFDKLPPDAQKLHLWAIAKIDMQMAAMGERESSAETMAAWRTKSQVGSLGKLPLIVLTRENGGFGDDLDRPAAELEQQRKQAQADLAMLSTRGKLVLVPSGHNMQVEAPDAVVKAIQEVIAESRH